MDLRCSFVSFRGANGWPTAEQRISNEATSRLPLVFLGQIERIELAGYHRRPGDLIRVLAFDDVEVVSVRVAIHTAAGAPVEEGAAAKEQGVWNYTATAVAPADEALVITVTAKDRAENEATAKLVHGG